LLVVTLLKTCTKTIIHIRA